MLITLVTWMLPHKPHYNIYTSSSFKGHIMFFFSFWGVLYYYYHTFFYWKGTSEGTSFQIVTLYKSFHPDLFITELYVLSFVQAP